MKSRTEIKQSIRWHERRRDMYEEKGTEKMRMAEDIRVKTLKWVLEESKFADKTSQNLSSGKEGGEK